MAANNEVGTIYPMEKIATIAQNYQVPFLCDASQAVGKIPIQFNEWGITLLALSAHKLYGPQGVGALVVRRDHRLEPLLYGGGQQKGLRPGTLNLPGIVGLGEACRLRAVEMAVDEVEIGQKRDQRRPAKPPSGEPSPLHPRYPQQRHHSQSAPQPGYFNWLRLFFRRGSPIPCAQGDGASRARRRRCPQNWLRQVFHR